MDNNIRYFFKKKLEIIFFMNIYVEFWIINGNIVLVWDYGYEWNCMICILWWLEGYNIICSIVIFENKIVSIFYIYLVFRILIFFWVLVLFFEVNVWIV